MKKDKTAHNENEIAKVRKIQVLLFEGFESLDVFGPIEVLGRSEFYELEYVSTTGGLVTSAQGAKMQTSAWSAVADYILLVPGGPGTRTLVDDPLFLKNLNEMVIQSIWVLSVCTGSALLAKAGLLDNRKATTNKRAYTWATSQSDKVQWQRKARWVTDGKFYTSSGVSAGTDMALGFVADRMGIEKARSIADHIEYSWQEDATTDPFA